MSLLYTSASFKYPEVDLKKNQEFMDHSTLHFHQPNHHHQHNSSLMRYRSAPTSFFECHANVSAAAGGGNSGDFRYIPSSSPDMDTLFSKYMLLPCNGSGDSGTHDLQEFREKTVKQEETESITVDGYSNGSSQMIYQSLSNHNLTNDNSATVDNTVDNSFGGVNSLALDSSMQAKMATGSGSNLARQNSSPAGLFSNLGVDNGFAAMRDVGCFRASNGTSGEASPSTSRLNNQLNFSPGSSSRLFPQIAEIGSQNMGVGASIAEKNLGSNSGNTTQYMSNFPGDSWDDTSFTGLKRARDNDGNMFFDFSTLETQNGNSGNQSTRLTHHLSLPKTSAEMAAVEKLLQFQGSVPFKIRAKRGCATHPRSIAERVRRTRISEKMRKLQELFPNMDKQTNTADMLDLAVEYIKDLQKQVKTLTDTRAKCTCSSMRKPY